MSRKTEPTAPYSLRRRLLVAMFTAFFVIISVISVGLLSYARRAADRTYDFLLEGSAIAILERVSQTQDGIFVDLPPSALEILELATDDLVFYRIFQSDGETLTGDNDLPLPDHFRAEPQHIFFDALYHGEEARFVLQSKMVVGAAAKHWIGVEVGQTRLGRNLLQSDLFNNGMLGLTGIALVGMIFVRLGISLAMRPLSGIENNLASRDPSDLAPLSAKPPREVQGLIDAINGFMRRLDANRDNTQSFIADVSHQIRTSLATLRGQLELALDKKHAGDAREWIGKASDQTARTIHLTNQLLSHAMVIHRADSQSSELIDVLEVAKNVLEEAVCLDANQKAEFEFDGSKYSGGHAISGDAISLHEALRNLIDNALKHGGPEPVVRMTVRDARLQGKVAAIAIAVCDNGPGILAAERENVLQRFYTLGDRSNSGLGLAIVKAVVDSHGGTLELGKAVGGGLAATITLPLKNGGTT